MVVMAKRGVIAIPGDGTWLTNPVHPLDVVETCVRAANGDVDDISIGGPDVLSRDDIARLAFAAVGRPARLLHVPTSALLASARVVGPFHRHAGELLEFVTRVFTSPCVAPQRGSRRMADYFAEIA
jgi:uncharacterized protein YbjT (DUF2867 family)